MASSTIDIEFYKDEIISLYHSDKILKNIVDHFSQSNNIIISDHTVKHCFKKWKIFKQIKTENSFQFQAQIIVFFYQCYLENKKILNVLHQEKYILKSWTF